MNSFSQFETPLPNINQIIVSRQFLGLGRQLEQKRRERRQADCQAKDVENRVIFLEKQQRRTEKDIQQKHQLLADFLSVRQRQEDDKQKKEQLQKLRNEQLEDLHRRAKQHRQDHHRNKSQAFSDLFDNNRMVYVKGRQSRLERQKQKMNKISSYIEQNQSIVDEINNGTQEGRLKIIQFKQEKSREHAEQYRRRMSMEEEKRKTKLDQMKSLGPKQAELVLKLQQSSSQHKQMLESFDRKHLMDTSELRKLVMGRTLQSSGSKATSYNSNKISNQKSLLEGKSRQRLNLLTYRRQKELSTTLDVLDKHHFNGSMSRKRSAQGNILEELHPESPDEEERREQIKVHKRKRNLHANRYKHYEIF